MADDPDNIEDPHDIDLAFFMKELLGEPRWARRKLDEASEDDLPHVRKALVRAAIALFDGIVSFFNVAILRRSHMLAADELTAIKKGKRFLERVQLTFHLFARHPSDARRRT